MSYSEKDGQITITMRPDTWQNLQLSLGMALGAALQCGNKLQSNAILRLINRIHEGDPNFTPYQVD